MSIFVCWHNFLTHSINVPGLVYVYAIVCSCHCYLWFLFHVTTTTLYYCKLLWRIQLNITLITLFRHDYSSTLCISKENILYLTMTHYTCDNCSFDSSSVFDHIIYQTIWHHVSITCRQQDGEKLGEFALMNCIYSSCSIVSILIIITTPRISIYLYKKIQNYKLT